MSLKIVNIADWDNSTLGVVMSYDKAVKFKNAYDSMPDRIAALEKWIADDYEKNKHLYKDIDLNEGLDTNDY